MGKASRRKGHSEPLTATLANVKAQVCIHCGKRRTPLPGTLWCRSCRHNARTLFIARGCRSDIWPPKHDPEALATLIKEMEERVRLDG